MIRQAQIGWAAAPAVDGIETTTSPGGLMAG